jgi:hypothetical protein
MENVPLLIKIVVNTIKIENVNNANPISPSVHAVAAEYQLEKLVSNDKINDSIYDNSFIFILK